MLMRVKTAPRLQVCHLNDVIELFDDHAFVSLNEAGAQLFGSAEIAVAMRELSAFVGSEQSTLRLKKMMKYLIRDGKRKQESLGGKSDMVSMPLLFV